MKYSHCFRGGGGSVLLTFLCGFCVTVALVGKLIHSSKSDYHEATTRSSSFIVHVSEHAPQTLAAVNVKACQWRFKRKEVVKQPIIEVLCSDAGLLQLLMWGHLCCHKNNEYTVMLSIEVNMYCIKMRLFSYSDLLCLFALSYKTWQILDLWGISATTLYI